MNDSNGMGPADIAALMKNTDGEMSNCWWFIILFAMIFGWGNMGIGGRPAQPQQQSGVLDSTLAAAAAQGGYVTSNQMNDALRLQSIQQGQRDIVDAVQQNKYDIVNANSASEARLIENQATLLANQSANAQAMQGCCSTINYNAAMNTASINQNTTQQAQRVLDALAQYRSDDLARENSDLKMRLQGADYANRLQQATAGVVRYPMATTYTSGMNPFCGCGQQQCCTAV